MSEQAVTETAIGFTACPCCRRTWPSRDAYLSDIGVSVVGYQANFSRLHEGLILFNHLCGTTMGLAVSRFQDLYKGPVYVARATGSARCPGHCKDSADLEPCSAECACAHAREILQICRRWPKADIKAGG